MAQNISHPTPRLKDLSGRGVEKIVKPKNVDNIKETNVFQTQHDSCSYTLSDYDNTHKTCASSS